MRRASCSCGQLNLQCVGEPVRISMCHCLECQRRTGSVYGVQARFPRDAVSDIQGTSSRFSRVGDSGGRAIFHFCPRCGTTVYWEFDALPEFLAIAVGAFADPLFPAPRVSVYEDRRHAWALPTTLELEHLE